MPLKASVASVWWNNLQSVTGPTYSEAGLLHTGNSLKNQTHGNLNMRLQKSLMTSRFSHMHSFCWSRVQCATALYLHSVCLHVLKIIFKHWPIPFLSEQQLVKRSRATEELQGNPLWSPTQVLYIETSLLTDRDPKTKKGVALQGTLWSAHALEIKPTPTCTCLHISYILYL